MYDHILLPTDGTESTDELVSHASDVAGRRDAAVHALHVVDDRSFFALDEDTEADVETQLRAEGEDAVARLARELESVDVEVSTAVRRGDPAIEICRHVSAVDADLVVMGTRGDEYTENMLGSTAQRVVSRATVPVLAVPIGQSP